jgi:hypothetical protein
MLFIRLILKCVMALQTNAQRQSMANKDHLVTVVLDTGCSIASTHREENFIELTATDGFINEANGKSAITGHGLVRWIFITEQGENVEVIV